MAYGDQPAMVCDLVDWARTCGFKVAAAGRGHKWNPKFRFSTPDTVWDHWGLTTEQAARGRLNPKMFNSFLDGTKPAIESAAIANACGLDAPDTGLAYPLGSIDDLPNLMRPRAQGGVLDGEGMVEVLNSLNDDGSEIGYDIRMGVWVSVRAETEYIDNWRRDSPPNSGLLQFIKMPLYALSPIKTGTLLYLTSLVFTSILLQNGYQYGYQSSSWQDKNF